MLILLPKKRLVSKIIHPLYTILSVNQRVKCDWIINPHLKSLTFHGRREAGNDVHPLEDVRLGADVRLNIRCKDELLVLDGEGLDRFRDPKTYECKCHAVEYVCGQ